MSAKLRIVGAAVFGLMVWGYAGYAFGGWRGAGLSIVILAMIGCVAHTLGDVVRYLTAVQIGHGARPTDAAVNEDGEEDGLSPEVLDALRSFGEDTHLNPFGPPTKDEAVSRILRDWLTGHGYLELVLDTEDQTSD